MRRYITLALCSSYLNYVLLPVFWSCHSFVSFAFVWCLRWSVDNGTCTVSKKKKCWWNQFLTHKNLTKSFVGWTRKSFLLSYHYLDSIAIQNEYTIIMLPDYEIIVKIWCCNMSHVLPTFVYQPYPDRIAVDKNSDYSKNLWNAGFNDSVCFRVTHPSWILLSTATNTLSSMLVAIMIKRVLTLKCFCFKLPTQLNVLYSVLLLVTIVWEIHIDWMTNWQVFILLWTS